MKPLPSSSSGARRPGKCFSSGLARLGLTKRALPDRHFIRDRRTVLLLLAACGMVLLPYASHVPGSISGFCSVLLAWRAWLTLRRQALPPRWLLLLLSAAGMGAIHLSYGTFLGRDAGVAMLVVLLACKLLEMRARRDLFVVIFLSFFLILALFFYSQSILVAAAMLVVMGLLLCVQLSMQFVQALPPLRTRLKLAARILGLAAPLALVLFVLFPRVEGPLWGQPGGGTSAGSGLSDSMSPGDISNLAMSETLAFRVRFLDGLPPVSALYWRGPVLGDFDGRTWRPVRRAIGQQRGPLTIQTRQAPLHYEVMLEPSEQHHLFALEVPHSVPHLRDNPVWLTADLELLASKPLRQRVQYRAASSLSAAVQAQAEASDFAPWLALPPGYNPAARALAAQLRRSAQGDAELVQATLAHFRTEAFHYTLQPPVLGQHTVDEFLFDSRSGFCEHYAGAFVFLMRAAGIPARVVTGYQGGEINPVDGRMSVRQSDAHAWAEVWLAGQGWLRVDPTAAVAPERVTTQSRAPLPAADSVFADWTGLNTLQYSLGSLWQTPLRLLRQGWEAANAGWNRWVLDYSSARQQSLLEFFGLETVDWRVLSGLLLGIGGLVASLVLLPLLRSHHRLPPAEALYQGLCQRLARLGHPKAAHEGPRAYARRLAGEAGRLNRSQQTAAIRFLTLYETMRYAQPGAAPASALAQLKSLLQECR